LGDHVHGENLSHLGYAKSAYTLCMQNAIKSRCRQCNGGQYWQALTFWGTVFVHCCM